MNLNTPSAADLATLTSIREKILVKRDAIDEIAALPRPVEEAAQLFIAGLTNEMDEAKRSIASFALPGDPPEMPQIDLGFDIGRYRTSTKPPHSTSNLLHAKQEVEGRYVNGCSLGLLALLMGPKELERKLKDVLRTAHPDMASALNAADRKQKIDALRIDLNQLLQSEEREVCKLETAGFLVERRTDLDDDEIVVVLQVWDELDFVRVA